MNWKKELLQSREKWYLEKYQAAKDHGVPLSKPYRDTDTNSLTRAVFDWLKFHNHYVNRINTQGQARKERVEYVGNQYRDIIRFTHSTTNKGTADIDSIIDSRPVKIEIKCKATKDRMRESQFKEKARIESSGGVYLVVTDMEMFLDWYKSFTNVSLPATTV